MSATKNEGSHAFQEDMIPPVRGRQLAALRACADHPHGLRRAAYPSAMSVLVARGLVEERPVRWKSREADETGWFLTDAGREMLATTARPVSQL